MRVVVALAMGLTPTLAAAQGVVVEDVSVGEAAVERERIAPDPRVQPEDVAPADPSRELLAVRLANLHQRKGEGWTLVLGGIAATVGGTVAAIVRREDQGWLAGGITTLSFGVINVWLGLGLLDLRGNRRSAILDGRHGVRTRYSDVREEEMLAERRVALVYGVNFGLDVAYIVAGALMLALGAATDPEKEWLIGTGVGMMSQGAFLLAFDLAGMVRASRRATAVRALPR